MQHQDFINVNATKLNPKNKNANLCYYLSFYFKELNSKIYGTYANKDLLLYFLHFLIKFLIILYLIINSTNFQNFNYYQINKCFILLNDFIQIIQNNASLKMINFNEGLVYYYFIIYQAAYHLYKNIIFLNRTNLNIFLHFQISIYYYYYCYFGLVSVFTQKKQDLFIHDYYEYNLLLIYLFSLLMIFHQ